MGNCYSLIVALALVGCATRPAVPLMSIDDLENFKIDCSQQRTQINLLEDQLTSRKFYVVDGVAGSIDPNRINKQFYTMTKVKIWTIRTECSKSR